MTLLTPPTSKHYTPEDLLAIPNNSGMELVDGQIVEKEVSRDSSESEGIILFRIQAFLVEHPIAKAYPAPLGYTCFPDRKMRKPDMTYDTDEKVREYLDAGFPLVWVADPKARTITVYPIKGRPAIFSDDDEITAEAVLPGFSCKVRDFFPITAAK